MFLKIKWFCALKFKIEIHLFEKSKHSFPLQTTRQLLVSPCSSLATIIWNFQIANKKEKRNEELFATSAINIIVKIFKFPSHRDFGFLLINNSVLDASEWQLFRCVGEKLCTVTKQQQRQQQWITLKLPLV